MVQYYEIIVMNLTLYVIPVAGVEVMCDIYTYIYDFYLEAVIISVEMFSIQCKERKDSRSVGSDMPFEQTYFH